MQIQYLIWIKVFKKGSCDLVELPYACTMLQPHMNSDNSCNQIISWWSIDEGSQEEQA